MERFIESHLWYCTWNYLLVLQFFACSSDKIMYKSFLVSYLGPFFKRSCQSNSVGGTSVSIPLWYFSSSLTMQTNYFVLYLQVNRKLNISLCRLRQVISISLLCSCQEPLLLSHSLVYVFSRFYLCDGEDSLCLICSFLQFISPNRSDGLLWNFQTLSYSYNFECVLCFFPTEHLLFAFWSTFTGKTFHTEKYICLVPWIHQ